MMRSINDERVAHYGLPLQSIPSGHPDAFTGKTFVFSGTLDSLTRDQVGPVEVEGTNGSSGSRGDRYMLSIILCRGDGE